MLPPLRRSPGRGAADRDLVEPVDLLEPDVDALPARGRQVLADVVGADRKLAVAAVGEHRELHPLGSPVVEQRVDRRPGGAPGEQHVVDEHHGAPVEVEVEVGAVDDRLAPGLAAVEVVAVEGDVEVAERHLGAGQLADQGVQAAAEDGAAGVDPDQGDGLRAARTRGSSRRSRARSARACGVDRRGRGRPVRVGFACAPLPGLSGPG